MLTWVLLPEGLCVKLSNDGLFPVIYIDEIQRVPGRANRYYCALLSIMFRMGWNGRVQLLEWDAVVPDEQAIAAF